MSLSLLDKLGKPQLLVIALIMVIAIPIVIHLFTSLSNVQKDYEYLRQNLVEAEKKITVLQQAISVLKDMISKMDKQLAIYETATTHQLQTLSEKVKANHRLLTQIYQQLTKKN